MEGLVIRPLEIHEDRRGWLGEIIRQDETGIRPVMSYISMTRPGLVRGPHEHREQTDYFCLIGRFRLYFWDNRKASPTYLQKKTVDTGDTPTIAVIPPGVVHAYRNIGDTDALVINLPDRLYRGWGRTGDVDEIRHEDDLLSRFRVDE